MVEAASEFEMVAKEEESVLFDDIIEVASKFETAAEEESAWTGEIIEVASKFETAAEEESAWTGEIIEVASKFETAAEEESAWTGEIIEAASKFEMAAEESAVSDEMIEVSASDMIEASDGGWSLTEVEAACRSISEVEEPPPPEKMEPAKMAPLKNAPRDALVMAQILKDMGITEYEPRVINQMLEFAFRYVTTILDDAKIYSSHAKKPTVDADDVRLAIQCRADQSFTSPPPRDFLLDIARQKNQTPLPLIKPYAGPRLPPDRYCLTAPNYRLKSLIKKGPNQGRLVPRLSVGAVSSRPTTPTVAPPQAVSVPNKVATPMSMTSQRFAVQIPPSQSTPAKPAPAVQNVLINPSMIGSKNILITNMVSSQNTATESNPLKRKHDDDDDNDTM